MTRRARCVNFFTTSFAPSTRKHGSSMLSGPPSLVSPIRARSKAALSEQMKVELSTSS